MQESLWVVEQVAPGNSAYNLPEAWRLSGPLDTPALQQGLDAIAARHESLRTHFRVRDRKPVQIVERPVPFSLRLVDLSKSRDTEAELQTWLNAEVRRPFELLRGPLARASLFRLADADHVLLLNFHHIIADEWSLAIIRRELSELYAAALLRKPGRLPELPIQYADFAAWQRERLTSGAFDRELSFWKKKLECPLPVLELPADFPRPGVQSFSGATQFHVLPRDLSIGLKRISREQGVTLFMTLMAGFQTFLYRYTRQSDLLVGSPLACREQPETESLVGFFVNTQPWRCDASDDPPFTEFLSRVRETTLQVQANQVPLDSIIEVTAHHRGRGTHPLFQTVFGLQTQVAESWRLGEVEARRVDVDNGGAKFDWTLLASETSDGLRLQSEYRTDMFTGPTVGRFVRHLQTLLEGIVAGPSRRLSELPLLTEAEERQLISALNPAPLDSAPRECLHDWFAEQVERTPNAVALSFESERVSYGDLNARANRLAHLLKRQGVGPDSPVALCLERSPELVVSCLGVLKAGGGYVPMDPTLPPERIAFILNDTQARVLVTQERLRESVLSAIAKLDVPMQPSVICIDSEELRLAAESATNPITLVRPENTAYIIYTSGSTGQPKGVLVSHANVVRLFERTQPWFNFDAADVWTLFHAYTFDFSVWELWGALLFGGRLVIVPSLISRSPTDFLSLLAREKVTVLNQTPSAFRQLIWAECSCGFELGDLSLRFIIFGGEALELQSLKPWFERHGDQHPILVNMYGITETTVHVTYRIIRRTDLDAGCGSVIGVPIPDLRLYVLDQRLRPVPLGVAGEICVGGAGVAKGYLNRPELTAERFVPDPWSTAPGAKLYRSGDLARFTSSRELEYLGRIDQQVKIRGFRIELGEIESALNRHRDVRESVVLVNDSHGERRLVGYVVPLKNAPSPVELRQHLARTLPDYMIPDAFVNLSSVPLTPNGKVDRRALPTVMQTINSGPKVPPRNDAEQSIVAIWAEILGHNSLGIHDNFFHLGGHSLQASQVVARLTEAFETDVPVRLMFETPTVAELAEAIARMKREQRPQPGGIPQRLRPGRARELLEHLNELSEAEVEELLSQPECQQSCG